jgi:hypothetical protein
MALPPKTIDRCRDATTRWRRHSPSQREHKTRDRNDLNVRAGKESLIAVVASDLNTAGEVSWFNPS